MPIACLAKRLPWVTQSPGVAGVTPSTLTLQVCSYNALTDVPTVVFDLNDKATTFVYGAGTFKMPQPDKVWVRSSNIRTPGEKISKFQYKNRHIQASIWIRGASTNAIQNTVHSLIAAIEQPPYVLQIAQPGSTTVSWADVVAVKHNVPPDPVVILGGAQTHIEIDFECRPGLRGNRITLSNLASNPGFEAPSGPAVGVFTDTFANLNAYTSLAGAAPTVAANVMSLAAGATVGFGSPAWSAINTWQVRFKWVTGLTINFHLHRTDANNALFAEVFTGTWALFHQVAGVTHTLATAAPSLTNNNFYWAVLTQFPAVTGAPPYVTATLYNDSAGSIGTQVAQVAAPTFDGVTALSGTMALQVAGATAQIGGVGVNNIVHAVSLFGPGGWVFNGALSTGSCAGTWEQNSANTSPGGPVTSFGAARIDLPPAGTVEGFWNSYGGGSPAGTAAIPVAAPGNVFNVSARVRSSGLSANAQLRIFVTEYDASGVQLRQDFPATLTGNQGVWTQLSGTVVTGAGCAYLGLFLDVLDTSAPGASANGTVWFDNVQCWNQTTTGAAPGAMPYCELRFPQSPAQLLVSGLQGDMAAPASLAVGTYLASWSGSPDIFLRFLVGARAQASAGAQLVSLLRDSAAGPIVTNALDSASYGGCILNPTGSQVSSSGFGYLPTAAAPHPVDQQGAYHLLVRAQTAQTTPNVAKVTLAATVYTVNAFGITGQILDQAPGAPLAPFAAQNTWTLADVGQASVPPFGRGAQADLSQNYTTIAPKVFDATGGGASSAAVKVNCALLLPVDGSLVQTMVQPTTFFATITQQYLWTYLDPLALAQSVVSMGYSLENTALPAPGHMAGGSGSYVSGIGLVTVLVNPTADPYLVLDPTQKVGATSVNQFGAVLTDQAAVVYPLLTEIQYTPLYLTPR